MTEGESDDRKQEQICQRLGGRGEKWNEDDRIVWKVQCGAQEGRDYKDALHRQLQRFHGDADGLAEYLQEKFGEDDSGGNEDQRGWTSPSQRDDEVEPFGFNAEPRPAASPPMVQPPRSKRHETPPAGASLAAEADEIPREVLGEQGAPRGERGQVDPPADTAKGSPGSATKFLRAMLPHPYFVAVPVDLFDSGLLGRLERRTPGLASLCIVLFRYQDLPGHVIRPSNRTLLRVCGLRKAETLRAHIRLLERGDKRAGIPPLLKRLPGRRAWVFTEPRLRHMAALAANLLAKEDRERAGRQERIRQLRQRVGTQGSAVRWGRQKRQQAGHIKRSR